MQGIPNGNFSLKDFFTPLTNKKTIVLISLVGFIVFFNMLLNGFVWDDKSYIVNNPEVHTILNFFYLFKENVFNNAGQYRPLVAVYFSLLYTLFGPNAFFYHFAQIFIHIANAILLFFFFCFFFDNIVAFIITLIFLVHPIQVESVSFIGASTSVLFFFFGILALLIFQTIQNKDKKLSLLFIPLLLLLSLLTKETGIGFLIMIVLLPITFTNSSISKDKVRLLLYIAIPVLLYTSIRFLFAGIYLSNRIMMPIARLSFPQRLLTIPEVFLYYIKTFFFPFRLSIDQQWIFPTLSFSHFYIPLMLDMLFLGLITLFGIYVLKKQKKRFATFLFFYIWFVIGIGFHLQIIPLDMTVADRWFYFSIVGVLGLIGIGLQILKSSFNKQVWNIAVFLCIAAVVLFSLRTILRNADWYNGLTLFSHDRIYNDNFDIENNLANEYIVNKDYQKAIDTAKTSIHFFPIDLTYYTLGNAYEQKGDIGDAKNAYFAAINAKDYVPWHHYHYVQIYTALARLLVFFDTPSKAKASIKIFLQDWPNNADLWLLLAIAEDKSNNHEAAFDAAEKAYMLSSNSTTSYVYTTLKANGKLNLSYSRDGLSLN